ncbi:hypothetical protein L599_004100000160 [Luteimonas sp. J16]|jgi:hypothetical protein|uniref:hypothetical protein n=1 Tax=unclassified Luteimonas TaxID=2629088 RepID=UPI0004BA47FA|nr:MULTISPECIES: hypothetical protein [unclassified Luteimonas]TWG89505.1 hypothetical protein L599_004100000160 [Luteimonas sp. J16]
MGRLAAALFATAFVVPFMASAQQAPPLQQAMSEAEFRAAGLHKLDAAELARLNAWLDRKVEQEAAAAVATAIEQAREEGRREVVERNRGFFHFGSDAPIDARIAGEFTGFANRRRYVLDNGQVWQQTDSATLAGVREANPAVRIRPGALGTWWMRVEGYNTQAKVQRIE